MEYTYIKGGNYLAFNNYQDNDLDILFDFDRHITHIVFGELGFGELGFNKRWAKEFNDPLKTKLLYTELILK